MLLLLLLFLLCLFVFSLLQRVGLRFFVKPPFRKNVVVFALFVCFFFVAKSRSQIFCKTSFSKKRKGNASYGRNNVTSPFFPLFLLKGRRSCVAIIPVAFSVIKDTTGNVLSRIARTLDFIISNMKNFQCIWNIDACCLSKRALKAETEIYISYW